MRKREEAPTCWRRLRRGLCNERAAPLPPLARVQPDLSYPEALTPTSVVAAMIRGKKSPAEKPGPEAEGRTRFELCRRLHPRFPPVALPAGGPCTWWTRENAASQSGPEQALLAPALGAHSARLPGAFWLFPTVDPQTL